MVRSGLFSVLESIRYQRDSTGRYTKHWHTHKVRSGVRLCDRRQRGVGEGAAGDRSVGPSSQSRTQRAARRPTRSSCPPHHPHLTWTVSWSAAVQHIQRLLFYTSSPVTYWTSHTRQQRGQISPAPSGGGLAVCQWSSWEKHEKTLGIYENIFLILIYIIFTWECALDRSKIQSVIHICKYHLFKTATFWHYCQGLSLYNRGLHSMFSVNYKWHWFFFNYSYFLRCI